MAGSPPEASSTVPLHERIQIRTPRTLAIQAKQLTAIRGADFAITRLNFPNIPSIDLVEAVTDARHIRLYRLEWFMSKTWDPTLRAKLNKEYQRTNSEQNLANELVAKGIIEAGGINTAQPQATASVSYDVQRRDPVYIQAARLIELANLNADYAMIQADFPDIPTPVFAEYLAITQYSKAEKLSLFQHRNENQESIIPTIFNHQIDNLSQQAEDHLEIALINVEVTEAEVKIAEKEIQWEKSVESQKKEDAQRPYL